MYHDLNPVIDARFVRVLPMEWFDFIGMRMELYSCQGKLLVNLFIPGWIIVLDFQQMINMDFLPIMSLPYPANRL